MQYYNPEFESYKPIACENINAECDSYADCMNIEIEKERKTKCDCFTGRNESTLDIHSLKKVLCDKVIVECKNSADMTLIYNFKTNKCGGDYSYYDDGGISGGKLKKKYMSYECFKKYVFEEIHSQKMDIVAIQYDTPESLYVCRVNYHDAPISEEESKYLLDKAKEFIV
jgi:hypothetical protein